MKPRKRINPISERQKERLKEYAKVKREFLSGLVSYQVPCLVALAVYGKRLRVTEIHHMRGRVGSLLCDTRYWMGVSALGHRYIHDHPEEARKRGWLCQKGDWNKP